MGVTLIDGPAMARAVQRIEDPSLSDEDINRFFRNMDVAWPVYMVAMAAMRRYRPALAVKLAAEVAECLGFQIGQRVG